MAFSITGTLVPATVTYNKVTGAMWLEYADGGQAHLSNKVRDHRAAALVLASLGAVRYSDWTLVASKSPLRQAHIEVEPGITSLY